MLDISSLNRSSECAICHARVEAFGHALILGHRRVDYFRCLSCGFVQTESPDWLDLAYSTAITRQDIGLVARNLELANRTESVIRICHDPDGQFLDFGGGYGLLTRLLRDKGLDFWHHDPRCENLFAGPAEITRINSQRWEVVTAFELFEHLVDPVGELERLLACTDTVFCSTVLLPEPAPRPGEWHYYGTEHGQHVSLFSKRALQKLASKCGVRLVSNGRNLHLLTRANVAPWLHRVAIGSWGRRVRGLLSRRESLLDRDARLVRSPAS